LALEFACNELQNDRVLVLTAVKQNKQALQFASKELRECKELAGIEQDLVHQ
jgi:hypothetical protein